MKARPEDGDPEVNAGELPLRRFLESARDAIIIANGRGTILAASPPALEMLRLPWEATRGADVATFLPELPLVPTPQPRTLLGTRGDASAINVELTVSRFGHNGVELIAIVLRDVSSRAQREIDAKRERRSLEDAIESLQAFSYVVGHDLKEPVRAMAAYLEEASAAEDISGARDLIERAKRAHDNLRRLLDGLLDWSRTVTTPLEPQPVNISDILGDPACRTQFEHLLQERGASLEIDPDLPTVYATQTLVSRALGNLITNAIRHNTTASPRVRIRAVESQRGGIATIAIDDNGPGFPATVLSDQLSAAHAPATIKRGFGLAIAKRAVERLGGTLRFVNRPEGGGRALLTLPTPSRIRTIEDRLRELI